MLIEAVILFSKKNLFQNRGKYLIDVVSCVLNQQFRYFYFSTVRHKRGILVLKNNSSSFPTLGYRS